MNWAFSEYWFYLGVVPLAALFLFFAYRRSSRVFQIWFTRKDYKFHDPFLKMCVRIAAVLMLVIALMGPYWGRSEQKVDVLGREVYILLDVSASMNAEDIKPSRLEKIKQELKNMVADLKGDKIGLIVFTSNAFVQCPLTTDYRVVTLFIDLLKTDQFANTGTDFRSGLSMALDRFISVEKTMEKITRSVILISDGEDFGDNYTSVIDRMKDENIKVFTVGVGTYEGAPVPELVYGKKKGYKKNAEGKVALSTLEDESLIDLADQFETQYHKIDEQLDDLQPVTEQIKLQSATVLNNRIEQVENNRYQIFLLGALGCLFFSLFWMPMRRKVKE